MQTSIFQLSNPLDHICTLLSCFPTTLHFTILHFNQPMLRFPSTSTRFWWCTMSSKAHTMYQCILQKQSTSLLQLPPPRLCFPLHRWEGMFRCEEVSTQRGRIEVKLIGRSDDVPSSPSSWSSPSSAPSSLSSSPSSSSSSSNSSPSSPSSPSCCCAIVEKIGDYFL